MKKKLLLLTVLLNNFYGTYNFSISSSFSPHINQEELASHVKVLASDEFQGRFPGTTGELRTLDYLTGVFSDLGLVPGNQENQSYLQEVPFAHVNPLTKNALTVKQGDQRMLFEFEKNIVYEVSSPVDELILSEAEIVFVGYGIVAPEYGWDDYADFDVKGKIVLSLVNDPGFITGDDSLFTGKAMTYYGRWKYKHQEALRQGAAGSLVIHQTEAAGYPWSMLQETYGRAYLRTLGDQRAMLRGWISEEAAFSLLGKNYHDLAQQAALRSHSWPNSLGRGWVAVKNDVKTFVSHNFLAKIPGKTDEVIIYTAHWDHFGVKDGQIYRGAVDNALGVSALISLAKAFKEFIPEKTILFLMPTAEEQGLLGSEYYVQSSLCSLDNIAAVLNVDLLNMFGKSQDVTFYGDVHPKLKEMVESSLRLQQRILMPDPTPETGMFFRSDHFPFARHGVPTLFINMGFMPDDQSKSPDYILNRRQKWLATQYHRPTDAFFDNPADERCWDLSATVVDAQLMFLIGYHLSQSRAYTV